jgi:hypothetical protein
MGALQEKKAFFPLIVFMRLKAGLFSSKKHTSGKKTAFFHTSLPHGNKSVRGLSAATMAVGAVCLDYSASS